MEQCNAPEVTSWSKVSMLEASHTNVNEAYAAVNRIRCDDMHPHIYKTTDAGKTWKEIVNGLATDPINSKRRYTTKRHALRRERESSVCFF